MSQSENQLDGAARASSPLKKKNDNTPEDTRRYDRLTPIDFIYLIVATYCQRQWRSICFSLEALACRQFPSAQFPSSKGRHIQGKSIYLIKI